jgi:hypothetical protein
MANLKVILLQVKNQLLQEGWLPPHINPPPSFKPALAHPPMTQPLVDFFTYLNENPRVAALLRQHGLEWTEVEQTQEPATAIAAIDLDDPFAGEVLGPACSIDNPDCESCQ